MGKRKKSRSVKKKLKSPSTQSNFSDDAGSSSGNPDIAAENSGDKKNDNIVPANSTDSAMSFSESTAEPFWVGLMWLGSLYLLIFLLGLFNMTNADIWWHLRTGELIWQLGHVPQTDWFTYTNPDAEWVDLHWGFQLIAAALWNLGGPAALILFKCVLAMMTFWLCMSLRNTQMASWKVAMVWLAPILIFAGRYYVRPEMLTYLFLAGTMAILNCSSKQPKLLWFLPLVTLFWVNVQGLFILQFVVMGCFLVDQFYEQFIRAKSDASLTQFKQLSLAIGSCFLAVLVNPYGTRGAMFPIVLFQKVRGESRDFYHQFSGELEGFGEVIQRAGLAVFFDLTPFLMAILTLSILLTFAILISKNRVSVYRLLMFAAFGYLAWNMTRNSPLYAIVGGMILYQNVATIALVGRQDGNVSQESKNRMPQLMLALSLLVLILSIPTGVYSILRPSFAQKRFVSVWNLGSGDGVRNADWFPNDAAKFLNRKDMPDRVYAQHNGVAAICIYHICPDKKVYADARLETNTISTLKKYSEIFDQISIGDRRADTKLAMVESLNQVDREKLPAIVMDVSTLYQAAIVNSPLMESLFKNKRWRCVYLDAKAAIVVSEEFAAKNKLEKVDTKFFDELAELSRNGTMSLKP